MNSEHLQHQFVLGLMVITCAAGGALGATLLVPGEYVTIQAAIDASVDGDTVLVADGTYTGPGNRDLDFGGRAITLQSENGPGTTTLDIQADEVDPHRAFYFHSGETDTSVVEGFTIENGFMNRGGAVLCEDGSSPLFKSCVFQDNSVSQEVEEDGGGAVYPLGSSPTFIDCEFIQNQAEANFLYGGGGAVRIQSGSSPTFTGCTFNENSAIGPAEPDGGAVAVWDGGHPEFYSCTFTANQAVWDGGITNNSGVTMHDCLFQDNVATGANATTGGYGQWGYTGAAHSDLVNCSFIGNTARAGGGASVSGPDATATFANCSFIGNTATSDSGGGIFVQDFAAATFANCLFADNEASGSGGGLWVGDDAEATVVNCTFAQNDASARAGLSLIRDGSADVANCVFWSNVPDQIGAFDADPPLVSYSNIQGGYAGDGNIDEDPLFVDPDGPDNEPDDLEDNDYRLSAGSPCIDSADNTAVPADELDLDGDGDTSEPLPFDLDGAPRFIDDPATADCQWEPGTCGDAPVADMGSYEFQVDAIPCEGDANGDGTVDPLDSGYVLARFGCSVGTGDADCDTADQNGDGAVDPLDVGFVLARFGACD